MRKLEGLQFDNTYARLPEVFYSKVRPTPFAAEPYLVAFNEDAARLLDLDPAEAARPDFAHYFGGAKLLPGSEPLAMAYAGHQFGSFVPRLGDGRALLLGEVRNAAGEKWDLHLKGAGQTPYSRGFDGRAVLRSTVREYLCGEAMHGLGIPTTRALCVVGADEPVRRESIETAAALLRLSPSHLRFGSFEFFHYRGERVRVRELADYCIANHFGEFAGAADSYEQLLREVVRRTASLVAAWQSVGFAHGVMNTDNMSVLGLTIDYGPYGFLDDYRTDFIPNHSDHAGRYAFGRQPSVALWNLACFAETLLPLVPRERAVAALDAFPKAFAADYGALMRAKLGFAEPRDEDAELVHVLLQILEAGAVDYTVFFRRLADFDASDAARNDPLRDLFPDPSSFDAWAARYRQRLREESSDADARRAAMRRVNPKFVLRNYLAQRAIEAAVERRDFTEIARLQNVLRRPFDEQPEAEPYAEPPPDWGRKLVISCSS